MQCKAAQNRANLVNQCKTVQSSVPGGRQAPESAGKARQGKAATSQYLVFGDLVFEPFLYLGFELLYFRMVFSVFGMLYFRIIFSVFEILYFCMVFSVFGILCFAMVFSAFGILSFAMVFSLFEIFCFAILPFFAIQNISLKPST